jgi:outer membrane protein assembly factor BamB
MNSKILRSAFFLAVLLLGALALSATAADWLQWRGVDRAGICTETGLLKTWPEGGPKLIWKATNLGIGYSAVSIAGNRVYTMGDGPEAAEVRALDAATGEIVWSAKAGKPGQGDGYPGPRCTPTVDGERLFAMSQDGELVALERATGKELWRKNMKRDFGGKMMSGWGYSESPLVDGDLLICTPGGPQGTLLALNKLTGEKVWQSEDIKENAAYSSIIVETCGGVRQYIQVTDASVFAVDAKTGKLLWRGPAPGRVAVIPTPIFANDQVFVACGYGVGCRSFRISKDVEAFKAEPAYDNKVMINHHGGVVKYGDNLYGFSDGKGWTCQDFKTGAAVWQEKEKLGKGAILCADGMLLCRGEDKGTMVLIEASPNGWNEKGRFEQPDRSDKKAWPHPIIANGRLYLRDQDVLLCYDVKGN